MSHYRISTQALAELKNIWKYTFKNWSKKQADRYYELVIEEIKFVSENYETGKTIQGTRQNYRFSQVKSLLLFYNKTDNNLVEIVRILHKRMQLKKHLD
jgi:toxin ParE1/3/4